MRILKVSNGYLVEGELRLFPDKERIAVFKNKEDVIDYLLLQLEYISPNDRLASIVVFPGGYDTGSRLKQINIR